MECRVFCPYILLPSRVWLEPKWQRIHIIHTTYKARYMLFEPKWLYMIYTIHTARYMIRILHLRSFLHKECGGVTPQARQNDHDTFFFSRYQDERFATYLHRAYKHMKICAFASLIQLCVRHKGDYCIPALNLDTKRIRFIYASVSLPGACRLVSAWPFASHILGDRSLPFRLQGGHHTVQARRAVSATTDTQADPT